MDDNPDQPPLPPEETWDQVSARVQAEVINDAYATSLAASFASYQRIGFSYQQAWELLLEEHRARLELMNQLSLLNSENTPPDDA